MKYKNSLKSTKDRKINSIKSIASMIEERRRQSSRKRVRNNKGEKEVTRNYLYPMEITVFANKLRERRFMHIYKLIERRFMHIFVLFGESFNDGKILN